MADTEQALAPEQTYDCPRTGLGAKVAGMMGWEGRGRCPLLRAARVRGQGAREGRADGEPTVAQAL